MSEERDRHTSQLSGFLSSDFAARRREASLRNAVDPSELQPRPMQWRQRFWDGLASMRNEDYEHTLCFNPNSCSFCLSLSLSPCVCISMHAYKYYVDTCVRSRVYKRTLQVSKVCLLPHLVTYIWPLRRREEILSTRYVCAPRSMPCLPACPTPTIDAYRRDMGIETAHGWEQKSRTHTDTDRPMVSEERKNSRKSGSTVLRAVSSFLPLLTLDLTRSSRILRYRDRCAFSLKGMYSKKRVKSPPNLKEGRQHTHRPRDRKEHIIE